MTEGVFYRDGIFELGWCFETETPPEGKWGLSQVELYFFHQVEVVFWTKTNITKDGSDHHGKEEAIKHNSDYQIFP